MIRLIEKEFVRECSYAFPPDSPLPQISSSLPQRLLGNKPGFDVDAEDLVTLRFFLRSRVACIQTREGSVSWNFDPASMLQLNFHQSAHQPHTIVQAAEKAARSISWDAATPARARALGVQGFHLAGEPQEHDLAQGAISSAVLEGESVHVASNGDNGQLLPRNGEHSAIAELGPPQTDGNGAGHQMDLGYVRLELLETESQKPHTILSSDAYSLALLGRYRLLADTLAGWAGAKITVVRS